MTIVIYQLKFLPKRLDIADTIIYCSCRLKQGESLKAVSLFDNHHITISDLPNLLIVHITSLIESQVQIQIVKMVLPSSNHVFQSTRSFIFLQFGLFVPAGLSTLSNVSKLCVRHTLVPLCSLFHFAFEHTFKSSLKHSFL